LVCSRWVRKPTRLRDEEWADIRTGASRFADLGTGDHADEPMVRSVAVIRWDKVDGTQGSVPRPKAG
jgi:hypothetical protein